MTAIRFGLDISASIERGGDPVATALHAEALGFDFVSANDHLHGPEARFEAWTMLSWIAARTSRIAVASRVLGVPYRHPAVLAKMAETFDRLSDGRLILGLGAGASEDEFEALGVGRASQAERTAGLREALLIVRGLWSERALSFEGARYRTRAARLVPKPARPIPIWLGTHGRIGLELTGQLADGWIPSIEYAPPDAVPEMLRTIVTAARDAGRDPSRIARIYNLPVSIGPGHAAGSSVVSGPPAAVADRLVEFTRLGFSGFNFIVSRPDAHAQKERLANEVMPAVRASV